MSKAIDSIQDLVKELTPVTDDKPKTYTAEVSHTDEEGIVWVRLPGADQDTPTASTSAEVKMGDVVNVEWRNNKLYIGGNYSNPSAGVQRVIIVEEAAKEADEKAQNASETAENAQQVAEAAKQIAGDTDQHFWFTETGTDTGAHITEATQEDFLADPTNGGGNLLARSNGIAARNGLTELATFTESGVSVSSNGLSNAVVLSAEVVEDWPSIGVLKLGGSNGPTLNGWKNGNYSEFDLYVSTSGAYQSTDTGIHLDCSGGANGAGTEIWLTPTEVFLKSYRNGGRNTLTLDNNGVTTNGNITTGGHSSPIGTVMTAYLASAKSASPSTATEICSISLPQGTWLLTGYVRFPSNNSGLRRANFDTSVSDAIHIQQTAAQGGVTQIQVSAVRVVTASTETWHLNAWHNSTSTLSLPAGTNAGYINGIRAVRIA